MAVERVVRCDFCGEFVAHPDRRRVGVRRDEDRPESAEYVDACLGCRKTVTLGQAIDLADANRPVMADGTAA